MRKYIRVSLISFSLALIIMISDGIVNFQGLEYLKFKDIASVVINTQIMGLGLYLILRFVDVQILDKKNIDSNFIRIISYLIVSICFVSLFVLIYSNIFVSRLPIEKQDNATYIISKYIMAFTAGYLYLSFGVVSFIIIEWINNKVKLNKFLENSKPIMPSGKSDQNS